MVEPIGFPGGLGVGCFNKKEIKGDFKVFLLNVTKIELSQLKWGRLWMQKDLWEGSRV